jgi:AcrR family transcriptional regulator
MRSPYTRLLWDTVCGYITPAGGDHHEQTPAAVRYETNGACCPGTSMTKTVDRRVERTRRTLREALVTLVLERGWDEITVKDVCDAADVGRSTFYAHFADKEELLTSGFDALAAHLRQPGERPPGTVLQFALPLAEHALDNRRLFRALIGKHSGRVVQRLFRQLVLDLVADELATVDLGLLPREATTRFLGGGIVELLSGVLDARNARPEAIDADIQLLARRVLR